MFDIYWQGLLVPFAYVVVLGGTFMTFSTIYRKRKAGMQSSFFQSDYRTHPTDKQLQWKAQT